MKSFLTRTRNGPIDDMVTTQPGVSLAWCATTTQAKTTISLRKAFWCSFVIEAFPFVLFLFMPVTYESRSLSCCTGHFEKTCEFYHVMLINA